LGVVSKYLLATQCQTDNNGSVWFLKGRKSFDPLVIYPGTGVMGSDMSIHNTQWNWWAVLSPDPASWFHIGFWKSDMSSQKLVKVLVKNNYFTQYYSFRTGHIFIKKWKCHLISVVHQNRRAGKKYCDKPDTRTFLSKL
jgi:hypothetical protein